MNRKSSIGMVYLVLAALALPLSWGAPEEVDYVGLFNAYLQSSRAAHEFKGSIFCQSQHIYTGQIQDPLPKALEFYYLNPVEDPIYQEQSPLFFKTYTLIDWNVRLENQLMEGSHKMTTASTDLFAADAMIANPSNASLKQMKSTDGNEYRISIPSITTENISIPYQIFTVPELFTWHYLPDLWYPEPLKLGFPADPKKVATRASRQVAIYTYTPEKLPDSLLQLLRKNSLNPNLKTEDLQIIFTVSRATNQCKSLQIATTVDEKTQLLLCVANNGTTLAVTGFTIPDTTVMYTQAAQQTEEGLKWGTNYFAQYTLNSFERSR